jgi:protein-tyrosine-phosphatase
VLFVCENGNVKSVMAAAYFNELAAERKLPLRAVPRGVASSPGSVPPAIVDGLRGEELDVGDFRPRTVAPRDVSDADRVVVIGDAELPQAARPLATTVERWSDVPSATANYDAARDSLRDHVKDLVERLSRPHPDD